jgi:aminoglycoside 6'-N-acetyltransferase I
MVMPVAPDRRANLRAFRVLGRTVGLASDPDFDARAKLRDILAMQIVDLNAGDERRSEAVAQLLHVSFADLAPDYLPTLAAAREAVCESFGEDSLSRLMLTDQDELAGFIAGRLMYGRLWELHPLAVAPAYRHSGCGRRLVADLAALVAARGGLTLHASTSDETGSTTLYGKDLYADPLGALRELRSTRQHPLDFYTRLGFALVGVMPDAEGPGKHSIHFALRV